MLSIKDIQNTIHEGDALAVLKEMPENCIDAIVTDPPAGINFMQKEWDDDKGGRDKWVAWMTEIMRECLRVLKPGGHAFVWALPRTSHWTTWAIESAGFSIREIVVHIFGSGFPKSLDVSKTLDRMAGTTRENKFENSFSRHAGPTGNKRCGKCGKWLVSGNPCQCPRPQDMPITDAAKQWSGWGTALKPAVEFWILARKPLSEPTVAANVLRWGCGALNIDGCRVKTDEKLIVNRLEEWSGFGQKIRPKYETQQNMKGRWPANLVHDGSDEVLALFPKTKSGKMKAGQQRKASKGLGGYHDGFPDAATLADTPGDSGSAARFFYCAKASRSEREAGLERIYRLKKNTSQEIIGRIKKTLDIS